MIINEKKYRFTFLSLLCLIIVSIFIFRLAHLQIVRGDHFKKLAENKMVQKITETAPRGSIYTADGYEIAKNKIGYTVELIFSNIESGKENEVLLELYNILEKNGEEFEDTFPILMEKGDFIFSYELEEREWKKQNDIPLDADAKTALKILRDKFNVREEISNELALEAIEKVHMREFLPITISDGDIVYTSHNKEIKWKKENGFSEEEYSLNAKASFKKLREKYKIDEKIKDEDARKIMVFRESVRAQGFRSWEPIEVATDVKLDTVFEIDSRKHELSGVTIASKPIRDYPFKTFASHVLGYIGKVSEADVESGEYKMTDLKGITGIEAAFEEYLKGVDGQRFAVTDYKGRAQNDPTAEVIDPIPGQDVYLTIDYDLQKTAEEALEKQIKEIQKSKAPNAKSGAVVALDVKTGAILAMASYPDYDLNLFTNGISSEDWNRLNVLVDDPLYPRPLYNNATLSALQPGSVFKPLMGIAGLEKGVISPYSTIYCRRNYIVGDTNFTCLSHHGSQNIRQAIRNSCNIFFYETGNRLGEKNLKEYAEKFGFGRKTGLEISESSGYLATKESKMQNYIYSISDYIRRAIGIEGTAVIINNAGEEQEVYKSYAIAKELATAITAEEYNTIGSIRTKVAEIMSSYNVRESSHINRITSLLWEGRWKVFDTINASIGQGGTSATPIQIANYLATLVNGGINRETYLVEKVVNKDGEITYKHEEKIIDKVDIDPKHLEVVKKGMKEVTMYTTGRVGFAGFDHNGIGVGGKTGTAQYGSDRIDNTGWFMGFAPYDDPEIVVVAMIIQGKTSGNSVPIVREVMDTYFYKNYTFEEMQKLKEKEKKQKEADREDLKTNEGNQIETFNR